MGLEILVGGASFVEFFDVTLTAGAYVVGANPVFTLNRIIESKFDRQESDGTIKATFTQNADTEALETFLETYAAVPADSAGVIDANYYENAVKYGGSATGKYLLMVAYGASNTDNTTPKIKTTFAYGAMSATSGSWGTKYKSDSQPTFEFVGIRNDAAKITIPTTAVNETYATLAAAFDLARNKSFIVKRLPVPAV